MSCFAKSIQPNSPGFREKMLWYSGNRAWAAVQFLSDHLSRPDKSSCWKSNFFLCSTIILVHWIPCISSNFSKVSAVTFTWEHHICSNYLGHFNTPSCNSDQGGTIRFFTTTTTGLLPEVPLVYMFTMLKPWGKMGIHNSLFRDWVITCMLFPRRRVFMFSHVLFWTKKCPLLPSWLFWPPHLSQAGSTVLFATVPFSNQKSCSLTSQQSGYPCDPFRETQQLASISISLIMLMIQLMVGIPRVTCTQDLNPVESSTTRATWSSS